MRPIFAPPLLALSTAACAGGSGPSAPDTSRFLGTWTYQPGSTIAIACAGRSAGTIDLSRVPPANQPGYFTFSSGAGAVLHEVDARGCAYDWTLSGDAAAATPGQSCATFPDGKGGSQVVHLQDGTKSTSDGATMAVDVHFVNDAGCAITVSGTAQRSP
jgi:hypothetical protein